MKNMLKNFMRVFSQEYVKVYGKNKSYFWWI